jgi:hypothetical protein
MIKVFSKTGQLLNIICSVSDLYAGTNRIDVTEPAESLQLGIMSGVAGKVFAPHTHLDKEIGQVHIQEAFVVMKGRAHVRIFDIDNSVVGNYPILTGDVTILLAGGHSLILDEDSIFYEFKTGPYEGQSKDKIFING